MKKIMEVDVKEVLGKRLLEMEIRGACIILKFEESKQFTIQGLPLNTLEIGLYGKIENKPFIPGE